MCVSARVCVCLCAWGKEGQAVKPSLAITICSTPLYSNPIQIPSCKQNGRLTLSPLAPSSPCKRRRQHECTHTKTHTQTLSYSCFVVPEQSSRGSELSVDQGTEDEMGADIASIMDRGRHPWLQMTPKSRTIPKQAQRKLKLWTDANKETTWVCYFNFYNISSNCYFRQ